MAVAIRLQRAGRKNKPFYRIIATDSKNACKAGNLLDFIGTYDPSTKEAIAVIDEKKAAEWMGKGAVVSLTVKNIFKKKGLIKE